MSLKRKAYYFLIGVFCFNYQVTTSQDQRIADSLTVIYQLDTLAVEAKLELLYSLSFNEINDFELSLKYSEELIYLSQLNGNYEYLSYGYFQKGNAKQFVGDLEDALAAYFESAEVAKRENLIPVEGSAYGAIADVYAVSDNYKNAMLYYNKAIATLRKTKDTLALASYILNAGDALLTNKKYDSALVYFNESGALFEEVDYVAGKAYNLGNIGMVYANTGKNDLAEKNINEAIGILEESGDYYPISVFLISMSDIYLEKEEHQTAIDYAQKSLTIAEQYGLKEQIGDANLKLSELYEEIGELVISYRYYKNHIAYRDSVNNIATVQQLADQRTNFEVSQKQIEVDLLDQRRKNQRNIAIATALALFLIGILAIGLFRRNKFIRKTKRIIEEERDRSDNLLLNILPEETADELKANGTVKAKKYEAVTVLFTDFKGFTSYSEKLSPEALVETVGFYFSKFDAIMDKYGLEKIKTIGDAYMCAGGLHDKTKDHAHRMVRAAFEIIEFVEATKKDDAASELTFDIRIGINTGPVVAGVVGTKKFAYDIWGDTVNVASRMESMSEPGKINISHSTYELIKSDFECEYRGEIEAKNKGKVKMYFVNGGKENTSEPKMKIVKDQYGK
ncbi:tetratricopeptide repeat protein [Maribacter polysiphoniae]|uniref:Adenylate cyclase n=1 Tax=Maribacter polysiphoniae TaxID=429344 RepID=A0A316DSL8_9FLAO|nr:adenylate/guanylate cyclase domain-containing protein [Maribacter polysiphoniae]MBD1262863.1 tetratricopeptide repeat protein [Maribacter polysiphoniae]PWK20179.1 class 3 adenylate cyclase [Maribacter polysiphoniae]